MRAALALAVALPLILASHWGILASAQMAASDLLFKTRASQPARSTVIIGIDQRTYRTLLPEHGPDPSPGVAQRFDVFVRPAPAIRAAAAGEGLANVTVARDSVVRGLPLLLRAGDERVPAMALTLAAFYARRPAVLDDEPRPGVVNTAGRSIPVSDGDIMAINLLGPPSPAAGREPVPIIPFVDVLEGRFDRSLVRDRIALIGPTILGVDEHPTPTSTETRMWGVVLS